MTKKDLKNEIEDVKKIVSLTGNKPDFFQSTTASNNKSKSAYSKYLNYGPINVKSNQTINPIAGSRYTVGSPLSSTMSILMKNPKRNYRRNRINQFF